MKGLLPRTLDVCGKPFEIRTDFRDILVICKALDDDSLTKEEKAYITLRCLFYDYDKLPKDGLEEAVTKAFRFVGGGDIPKTKDTGKKMIDFEHDGFMLYPAISKTLGVIDVRDLDYLHWFTFLGAFGEIGNGLMSYTLSLRGKMNEEKKLEKNEREFLDKNRDIIMLRSKEEQAAIEETEAFLDSLGENNEEKILL